MKNLSLLILLLVLYQNSNAQYKTFTCGEKLIDSRDGQSYTTINIGTQCWMAQNLNFGKTVLDNNQTNNSIIEKSCYDNNNDNCNKYGGLYTFFEALQWNETEKVQGVCPSGWHVPANSEWSVLNNFLGVDSAGLKVKASPKDPVHWDGSNISGFNAIPAGVGLNKYYGRLSHWAVFWSSTPNADNNNWAWSIQLDGFYYPIPPRYLTFYQSYYFRKENSFSIRCIKD